MCNGISAVSDGIGCASRADAVGTVERDGLFYHVRVCACVSSTARCSVTGLESFRSSPQLITLKSFYHV